MDSPRPAVGGQSTAQQAVKHSKAWRWTLGLDTSYRMWGLGVNIVGRGGGGVLTMSVWM